MPATGTVLIVDDDADVALSAKLLLRPLFGEVVVAHDPAAIPALLKAHDPDVILLDMNFARGQSSGVEGFRGTRNHPRRRPPGGRRHHHRLWRGQHRRRGDEARRHRFRDQALGQ